MGRAQRQVYHLEIHVSSSPPLPAPSLPSPPRLPRACSRFPAPSGRPTFRSWLPSTPRASPPPEPRLKMRPSVRCAQPAEGRARGEESWQRIRGARRRNPPAASPESHLSPGASVAWKSVSVTHNRFSVGGRGRGGAKGCAWAAYLVFPRASCGQSGVLGGPLPTTQRLRLRGGMPWSCGWSALLAPPGFHSFREMGLRRAQGQPGRARSKQA